MAPDEGPALHPRVGGHASADAGRPRLAECEWLQKYPTLEALAAAPETDVSHTWRPLGYNIRPKRLHAIARESMVRYGGQLPSDEATLLSFKGIGEYWQARS